MKKIIARPKNIISVYKEMKANPDTIYEIPVPGDFTEYWKLSDFRRWFRDCLDRKINRNDVIRGKKDNPEYRLNLYLDCTAIRRFYQRKSYTSGRNILRLKELQSRYPEVNNPNEEF